jgi:hypothetical protein
LRFWRAFLFSNPLIDANHPIIRAAIGCIFGFAAESAGAS